MTDVGRRAWLLPVPGIIALGDYPQRDPQQDRRRGASWWIGSCMAVPGGKATPAAPVVQPAGRA